ncbi:MAG: hypothetical protein ACK56I_33565, partial [bacterium]
VRLVALRRMRGVELPPIGLWAAPRLPADAHLVSAPVQRETRVAALRVSHDTVEVGRLPAAVQMQHRRQLRGSLWKRIESRDTRRRSFENTDLIAHNAADDAVLLPFL